MGKNAIRRQGFRGAAPAGSEDAKETEANHTKSNKALLHGNYPFVRFVIVIRQHY
jgi:hypothetical protein